MSEIGLIGKKIGMSREFFKTGQSIPVTVLKVEKARVIQLINKEKKGVQFWKTHNSFCRFENKYAFTDLANTAGVIYVVRDPRNVVSSYSNHYQKSLKDILRMRSDNTLYGNFFVSIRSSSKASKSVIFSLIVMIEVSKHMFRVPLSRNVSQNPIQAE